MEISALTRSVVKRNHAVISPDGFINSRVPGWDNCTVNVIINEQMGAQLTQTLITAGKDCRISGVTKKSQVFFMSSKENVWRMLVITNKNFLKVNLFMCQ